MPLLVWQLGAFTMESRGMDTRLMYERSALICNTIAVSD